MNYPNVHADIGAFAWDAPATPVVSAAGGRRAVTLSFDQERGTQYDIYRVVDGVRQATPFVANVRGQGTNVPVVVDKDDDNHGLDPNSTYEFQVQATRLFNVWQGQDMVNPTSPFSAVATVATAPVQAVRFLSAPAATTTDHSARLTWAIDGNDAGDAPFCVLDGAAEVACTTTGATLTGLGLGQHTLTVYPADGEGAFPASWTVVAAPAAPAAPAVVVPRAPVVPANPADLDRDGIQNTWLVGGKPVAAPKAPKAAVTAKAVTLTLPAAPKAAKGLRVYRADGQGAFKLVKTVSPKGGKVTDTKVKPGHTYRYKTVAVNAKGQQSTASRPVSAKIRRK